MEAWEQSDGDSLQTTFQSRGLWSEPKENRFLQVFLEAMDAVRSKDGLPPEATPGHNAPAMHLEQR